MALKIYYEGKYLFYGDRKCVAQNARINWNQSETIFSIFTNTGKIIENQPLAEVVDKLDAPYADRTAFETAIDDFFVEAPGGGGISGNVSENVIPIGGTDNSLVDSLITYSVPLLQICIDLISPYFLYLALGLYTYLSRLFTLPKSDTS